MKKLFFFIFISCLGLVDAIYALDMQEIQCKLEKAVLDSDVDLVHTALNQGASAHKKIACIKEFRGRTIEDLADSRIAYWKKTNNTKKLESADRIRDTIVNTIGRELSGQGVIRESPLF